MTLSLNVYRFPFLWDDFDFMGRAMALRASDLLPEPSVIFYRPLSREVYFWVLTHALGMAPMAGHVLNTAFVAGTIAILMSLMRQMAGGRAALISGLIFACSAALPLGISWASASQDLLCALLGMAALYAQWRGKVLLSLASLTGALLSKETAVSIVPPLMAMAALRGGVQRSHLLRIIAAQVTVVLVWAAIHPWIRSSLLGGSELTPGAEHGYLLRGSFVPALVQGFKITLNVPWVGGAPSWPPNLILPALLVSVLVALVINWRARRGPEVIGANPRLALLLGLLVMVCSILLTSYVLGGWSTHYVCVPALGLAMVGGAALTRVSSPLVAIAIIAFLWLGIGLRGNRIDPILPTESNFSETARAVTKVEHGFKLLHPTLPAGSNVFVSVQTRGAGGLYRYLFRLQPLRVWYRNPDLWVLDPNRRREKAPNEFLFWIDPDLSVFEIRLSDLYPHGPTKEISLPRYQKTLRGYAMGLAGAGDIQRAVYILVNMPENSPAVQVFDRRTAVALLLAAGRRDEAARLSGQIPALSRHDAFEAVVALLAEPVSGLNWDEAAMLAFGLDPSDVPSLRIAMQRLEAAGYKGAAARFATRIADRVPNDTESAAVLRRATVQPPQEITVPIPYDVPQ